MPCVTVSSAHCSFQKLQILQYLRIKRVSQPTSMLALDANFRFESWEPFLFLNIIKFEIYVSYSVVIKQ